MPTDTTPLSPHPPLADYYERTDGLLTRLRTGNPEAAKLMRYYWDTTLHCVPPATILAAMTDAGFAEPRRDVEAAIFSEYTARA